VSTISRPDNSLSQRILSGVGWFAVSRILIQCSLLATSTVVARRVPPSAYGVIAMAFIVTGLAMLLRDLGTTKAVIQKRELNQGLLSSIFWINMTVGCTIAGLCFVSAPLAGTFFHEHTVVSVLRVLSSLFVISSLGDIQSAILNREMAFKRLSLIDIFSSLVRITVALSLACLGAGVWALVASTLADAAIGSALLWRASNWRPTFIISWRDVRTIMDFGLNLSAFNFFNYFARNADNAIIGRFLGSTPLGYYQLAYSIMMFPVQGIAQLLGRVLFPAFSEIQHDNTRFRSLYLRACSMIALVTFPLMTEIAIMAGPLIRTLYGAKWISVIPVLTILAPVGLVQSILTTTGQIYTAKGRADLIFRVGSVASALYVISFFVGLPWGIRGVALSYAICNCLVLLPLLCASFRLIELRLTELWKALRPITAATSLMALAVYGMRAIIHHSSQVPTTIDLLISVTTGTVVYMAAIYAMQLPVVQEIIDVAAFRRICVLQRVRNAEARP
jgi:O-antigen/teichoic acid export membrane protein